MKLISIVIICSILLSGCVGCEDNKKKTINESRLDRDYEFVIGHVQPDEDRKNSIEVFVGRLLSEFPDSLNLANIQDYLLKIQLGQYENHYKAILSYHDDAKVFITVGAETVELQNVGRGTYRDITNSLHISALQKCSLRVTRSGGRIYNAQVTVPDHITIANKPIGDTVLVYPKRLTPLEQVCCGNPHLFGPEVTGAYYYRFEQVDDYYQFDTPALRFLSSTNGIGAPICISKCGETTYNHVSWTAMAFDTVLTRAWGIGEPSGVGFDILDSLTVWRFDAPITYRSNITDQKGKKIAGYFGAYNSLNINFVEKVLRDSCKCD